MNTNEELKNEIEKLKKSIDTNEECVKSHTQNIENYKKKIAELEKQIKEQEVFQRNPAYVLENFTVKADGFYYNFTEGGHFDKLDSLLAMLDLAERCNKKFPEKKHNVHVIIDYNAIQENFNFAVYTSTNTNMVRFNSVQSASLAIEEINKSPELTRLAKIWLGVEQ